MTDSTLTIELTRPSQIDADPARVGHLAASELSGALAAVEDLLPEAVVQARSSYASIALDRNPGLVMDAIEAAWLDSDAASALVRAGGLIAKADELLRRAADELDPERQR